MLTILLIKIRYGAAKQQGLSLRLNKRKISFCFPQSCSAVCPRVSVNRKKKIPRPCITVSSLSVYLDRSIRTLLRPTSALLAVDVVVNKDLHFCRREVRKACLFALYAGRVSGSEGLKTPTSLAESTSTPRSSCAAAAVSLRYFPPSNCRSFHKLSRRRVERAFVW